MAKKKVVPKNQKKTNLKNINEFSFVANKTGIKPPYLWAFILGLLAFLLYADTVVNGYVLDDSRAISMNLFVQKGISGIPKLLTVEFWYWDNIKLGYYRPLSLITFAIEHQFFGNNPHISHLFNALFFGLTAFLLFLVLAQLLAKRSLAFPFLITLIFITHPIHTEVVANIKSRDEILSFLSILGMLFFALRQRQKEVNAAAAPKNENSSFAFKYKDIVFSLFFFYLALLSKETGVVGIILMPFFLFYSGENIPAILKKLIPFAGVAALFFLQKYIMLGYLNGDIPDDVVNYPYIGSSVKFPTAFKIFTLCLKQLVLPWPLSFDYSYDQVPAVGWSGGAAIFGLLLFTGLAIVAFLQIKKKSAWGLGLGIIFITIIPSLAFVFLRGGIMAERFLYAPVLGLGILAVYALAPYAKSPNIQLVPWLKNNTVPSGVILLVCLIFSVETIGRNLTWKDNITLFSTDEKHSPNSCQVPRLYGDELVNRAREEKDSAKKMAEYQLGMSELQRAITIHPNFGDAYFKLAVAWQDLGHYDSAIKYYNIAIETAPGNALAFNDLGLIYQYMGKNSLASFYYNEAARVNPQSADGPRNEAALKASTGLDVRQFPDKEYESLPLYLRTDQRPGVKPEDGKDYNYYFQAGCDYRNKGDYASAINFFKKCVDMQPQGENALINLANSYGMTKHYPDAVKIFEKILTIDPDNKMAIKNIGLTYEKMGNTEKASEYKKRL